MADQLPVVDRLVHLDRRAARLIEVRNRRSGQTRYPALHEVMFQLYGGCGSRQVLGRPSVGFTHVYGAPGEQRRSVIQRCGVFVDAPTNLVSGPLTSAVPREPGRRIGTPPGTAAALASSRRRRRTPRERFADDRPRQVMTRRGGRRWWSHD